MENDFWNWLIVGGVLIILEAFIPAFFLLWFGSAAVVIGFVVFFVPNIGWEVQIILFAFLSLASVSAWKMFLQSYFIKENDHEFLNQRGHELIGKVYELDADIHEGEGRISVKHTSWIVNGPEGLKKGDRVKVTGIEGIELNVESAEEVADKSESGSEKGDSA